VKVLLIEDSERLRRALGVGLRKHGFTVDVAGDGGVGFWLATTNVYDVIVLDLMLPGMDGLTLLRRLRASGKENASSHVLVLTAKDTIDDRVHGLQCGADDYLVKPFAFDELVARVQSLVRRRHNAKSSVIKLGRLALDTLSRTLRVADVPVELSPRDYTLLHYLMLRRGQIASREEIEAQLYDESVEVMSNVVDAAVYALRKKIELPGGPPLIQTRRGMGYVLDDEPRTPMKTPQRQGAS
jgi:DNA-binding response OmpR family regulator